jgi:hypothetical protein
MALWEYIGEWASITKLLCHFNWGATDSSWNWNDGNPSNVSWVAGKLWSWAASWNGTNSNISYTNNSSLRPTWNFTISWWIKVSWSANRQWVFQSYSQSWAVSWIQLMVTQNTWEWGNENKLRVVVWANTWFTIWTQYQEAFSWVTITDNTWKHFWIVYNWSNITIYINWVAWTSASYSAWVWYNATNYVRALCNNNSWTNIQFLNWVIDELIFESRAWSDVEFRKQYTAQKWLYWII